MILSDREIMAAIARKAIFIKDCPPSDSPRWSSTALDLTLDAEIRPWKKIESVGEDTTISPVKEGFDSNALAIKYTKPHDCTNGYVIKPGEFVLGWTVERIKLPHTSRIAARVEGKSSLARIGLGVHVTAPTIHAGFGFNELKPNYEGSPIRLEIWNIGPLDIKLTKGMPICQLIFEEVHGTPEQGYSGQHNVQGPKLKKSDPKKKAR
jgi:dCTP deaminase